MLHSLPDRSPVPTVALLLTLPLWTSLRLSLFSLCLGHQLKQRQQHPSISWYLGNHETVNTRQCEAVPKALLITTNFKRAWGKRMTSEMVSEIRETSLSSFLSKWVMKHASTQFQTAKMESTQNACWCLTTHWGEGWLLKGASSLSLNSRNARLKSHTQSQ